MRVRPTNASFRLMAKIAAVFTVVLLAIGAKPAAKPSASVPKERYLSPIEMALSPDSRLLYVVCQDSDEVRVIDAQTNKVVGSVAVGRMPRGIAASFDGRQL